jgi:hypothetical protein
MEISSPVWDAKGNQYVFRFHGNGYNLSFASKESFFVDESKEGLKPMIPDVSDDFLNTIINEFIEKTNKYFTSPLRPDVIRKRLRHEVLESSLQTKDLKEGWYTVHWNLDHMKVQSKAFIFVWKVLQFIETEAKISSDFLSSTTPRAQSPEAPQAPEQSELRTIHIQDSLIPVGDLPLSDFPSEFPLGETADEKSERQMVRRKVREARLRAALAKLKAQKLEEKYYSKYSSQKESSEDSSLSSESDSDEGAYL